MHTAAGRSGCFEFLFWFNSDFLLSKTKSLFSSPWTKICQILHVILESISQLSFKFWVNLQCHQTWLLRTFSAQTLYILIKSSPLKCKFFRFSGTRVKIPQIPLMSILNWQVSSLSIFASFFIVMTNNSSSNFKLIHFLLWIKGPNKIPNFETFVCSGKNLPNFSCHFLNHKSLFH